MGEQSDILSGPISRISSLKGNKVVHDHSMLHSQSVKVDTIHANLACLFIEEHLLESFGLFSHGRCSGHEPAIAYGSLSHVSWHYSFSAPELVVGELVLDSMPSDSSCEVGHLCGSL